MAFAAGGDKLRGAFREGVRYCDTRREILSYAQICSHKGFQLFLRFILFQFELELWMITNTMIAILTHPEQPFSDNLPPREP